MAEYTDRLTLKNQSESNQLLNKEEEICHWRVASFCHHRTCMDNQHEFISFSNVSLNCYSLITSRVF